MTDHVHVPQTCANPGCDQEATYFLSFEDATAEEPTEYLCADCCESLYATEEEREDEDFTWEPRLIRGRMAEFGCYSCHPDCEDCDYNRS